MSPSVPPSPSRPPPLTPRPEHQAEAARVEAGPHHRQSVHARPGRLTVSGDVDQVPLSGQL